MSMGGLTGDVLMPGLLGAAGGVALQLVWSSFGASLLPCSVTGNQMVTVAAQTAGAIGLGWLAGKGLGKAKGDAVAVGAVAIVLYNYVAGMISTTPALQGLRGPRLGGRFGKRMAAYLPGQGLRPMMNTKTVLGAYMPGQGLRPQAHRTTSLGAYRPMNPAPFLRGRPGSAGGGMFR